MLHTVPHQRYYHLTNRTCSNGKRISALLNPPLYEFIILMSKSLVPNFYSDTCIGTLFITFSIVIYHIFTPLSSGYHSQDNFILIHCRYSYLRANCDVKINANYTYVICDVTNKRLYVVCLQYVREIIYM
jgi:hypothetical protein